MCPDPTPVGVSPAGFTVPTILLPTAAITPAARTAAARVVAAIARQLTPEELALGDHDGELDATLADDLERAEADAWVDMIASSLGAEAVIL